MNDRCPKCGLRTFWPRDEDDTPTCHACGFKLAAPGPTWLTPAIDASLRQQDARTKQAATRRARDGAARARRA